MTAAEERFTDRLVALLGAEDDFEFMDEPMENMRGGYFFVIDTEGTTLTVEVRDGRS